METFQQFPQSAPPRRGWWSRNWLWFVPTVILASFLLCGGCCAGLFLVGLRVIKNMEPYQMALRQVQNDPQVIERLGQPIEDVRWIPTVQWNVSGDRGDATIDFDVAGPKGKAQVRTQARMINNVWGLTTLEVTFEDRQRLMLDTAGQGGLEEAPAWPPSTGGQREVESAGDVVQKPDTHIQQPDTDIQLDLPDIPKPPK